MGGVASPSSAGNSIWLYLQHTLPPALGARQWGHERAATAGESSPLCGASAGSFASKGSPCCLCWVC